MKFDTIKPLYLDYAIADPEGRRLDSVAAHFTETAGKYKDKAEAEFYSLHTNYKAQKRYKALEKYYDAKEDSVSKIIEKNSNGYQRPVYGYSVMHRYRAKNGFGALTIQNTYFETDSSLNKITDVGVIKN
jgi:hypothetical protein